jgi:ferredoxin
LLLSVSTPYEAMTTPNQAMRRGRRIQLYRELEVLNASIKQQVRSIDQASKFLLMLNFTFTVKTMADVANKYAENVAGAFYVDDQCIDCDLCRETAPASFKRNDDGGHTYVYKQPETPEEEALCKEAMEGCPVEAIGNDGAIILAPLRA